MNANLTASEQLELVQIATVNGPRLPTRNISLFSFTELWSKKTCSLLRTEKLFICGVGNKKNCGRMGFTNAQGQQRKANTT